MAKELPYFKFEPSEWENGNIQLCTSDAKALFIELCCTYWVRLGGLSYELVLMKHCKGDETFLKELEKKQIIKIKKGNLIINFLDIQLEEFGDKSLSAKKSADARWNKKRNANASETHSERNAIREEKIIGEKKRGDKIIVDNTVEILDPYPFNEFWDKYDKKRGDNPKIKKMWDKLSEQDRQDIMEYIPFYINSQPDKKYRKDPQTFLNNKAWKDELINEKNGEYDNWKRVLSDPNRYKA